MLTLTFKWGNIREWMLKDDNVYKWVSDNRRLNPYSGNNFSAIDLLFSKAALAQHLSWTVKTETYSSTLLQFYFHHTKNDTR